MISVSQRLIKLMKADQSTLFPDPATKSKIHQELTLDKGRNNARFPCIHNKEPADFHRLNVRSLKNH